MSRYWVNTKTFALQNIDSSKSLGIQRVLDHYSFKYSILFFDYGPNDLSLLKIL